MIDHDHPILSIVIPIALALRYGWSGLILYAVLALVVAIAATIEGNR